MTVTNMEVNSNENEATENTTTENEPKGLGEQGEFCTCEAKDCFECNTRRPWCTDSEEILSPNAKGLGGFGGFGSLGNNEQTQGDTIERESLLRPLYSAYSEFDAQQPEDVHTFKEEKLDEMVSQTVKTSVLYGVVVGFTAGVVLTASVYGTLKGVATLKARKREKSPLKQLAKALENAENAKSKH